MNDINTTEGILDFAIEQEQNAVDFYFNLSETTVNQEMKAVFIQFAKEEMGHKAKLIQVQKTGMFEIGSVKINDLKIADFAVNISPNQALSYDEALILAMKREKAAFRLYTRLAERTEVAELKQLFYNLAMEESKHKLRFEIEYDDFVLREN